MLFNNKLSSKIILLFIVVLAFFLRIYGLNWDQEQHLHPDERFLTMVLSSMKIPHSFLDYLNPQISTMNPYNLNYSFFVYGTFPLNITRIVGEIINQKEYWNIHFVGRFLSALFDLGIIILLFKIGQKIFNDKVGLLSAFVYSIMVLPIQLSHFFAVDTFLNFFLVLSFYILILAISSSRLLLKSFFLGISFGLALASKISALYFVPVLGIGYIFLLIKNLSTARQILKIVFSGIIFLIVSLFVFRIAHPSAFFTNNYLNWQPNPQFVKNLNELKSSNNPNSWYPPAVQWHSTKSLIFPLRNIIFWGLGLPLGIISLVAVIYAFSTLIKFFFCSKLEKKRLSRETITIFLSIIWIFGLFTYQGLQFVKSMRYLLPIYPFLAILSAIFICKISEKVNKRLSTKYFLVFFILFIVSITLYPVSFLSIYSRPITRVTASKWIYENIPPGSTVTYEEWDDGIPVSLPNYPPPNFTTESLMMYDTETSEKWQRINEKLAKVDYIFITSNRAYGSTMKLPEKYPQTTAYYQSLFEETGNFVKIAEFTSYPCFPPFGNKHLFCFNDDSAEEAFTVYDHPKVLIFKRKNN